MRDIRVQTTDFDSGAELALLEATGAGAVASFTGQVRRDDGVDALTLDHYPAMTQRALERLAEEAEARWPLSAVTLIHRVGRLEAGARIVFVGTASDHRAAALEACAFLIDRLKTDAPFWKREHLSGEDRWVEAKAGDDARAETWGKPKRA
jgi:molybdopterin synthase catalytic subunit